MLILTGCLILVSLATGARCQTQALMSHEHPHNVMAKSPCPKCLDGRWLQHYHQRQCRPVVLGGCQCPSRFECHGYLDENNNGLLTRPMTNKMSTREPGRYKSVGRSFADQDEDQDDDNTCQYNGQVFQIGQIVPTEDPCRICVCHYMNDGTLNIDCQTKIECPAPDSRMDADDFNGYVSVSPPGALTMLRTQFRRRRGPQSGSAGTNPSPNETLLTLFCYDFYKHDRCCPRQECLSINTRTGKSMRPRKVCNYAGHEYHLGEKIKLRSILEQQQQQQQQPTSLEDPDSSNQVDHAFGSAESLPETLACLSCICTEHWNNTIQQLEKDPNRLSRMLLEDQISCRRKHCYLDFDPRFRRGCIPVYDREKCCPVDFVCPRTRQMSLRVRGVDYGSKMCHFEGRKYPIGARIYQTKHWAAECVDCECRLPPEFTCLRRKDCQTSPREKLDRHSA